MCISSTRQKNKRMACLCVSWAAVVVCMAVIFALSHETATQSQSLSDSVLTAFLRRFGIVLSSQFVRKTAHALEYCGLAVLLYNACYQSFRRPQPTLALLATVLYAATDEIHQYFVLGRACQLRDVFVDFLGAVAGIVGAAILFHLFKAIFKKREV